MHFANMRLAALALCSALVSCHADSGPQVLVPAAPSGPTQHGIRAPFTLELHPAGPARGDVMDLEATVNVQEFAGPITMTIEIPSSASLEEGATTRYAIAAAGTSRTLYRIRGASRLAHGQSIRVVARSAPSNVFGVTAVAEYPAQPPARSAAVRQLQAPVRIGRLAVEQSGQVDRVQDR